jgi:cell wall-associated NlpC family hydrolase
MKKVWIAFGVLLIGLLLYKVFFETDDAPLNSAVKRTSLDGRDQGFHSDTTVSQEVKPGDASPALGVLEGNYVSKSDSIVAYALQRYGTDYTYGGATDGGFDCSGFITFVYNQFGVKIPHGSSLQAKLGESVAMAEARKGDIIVFTGTNLEDRTPGHVGIVITPPAKPIKFVHSSSNGGVKVSEVEGTLYQKRFLDIRRVLP